MLTHIQYWNYPFMSFASVVEIIEFKLEIDQNH